jgi:uncharacterized protein YeeX (DUF496 family)
MAARENQGLQIALIVFVMLTILLVVSTYMVYSHWQDQIARTKTAETNAATAATDKEKATKEKGDLLTLIGAAPTDAVPDVLEQNKKMIDSFAQFGFAQLPEDQRTFQKVVKGLVDTIKAANTTVAETKATMDKNKKDYDDGIAKATANTAEVATARDAAVAQLAEQTKKYNEAVAEVRTTIDKLAKEKADINATLDKTKADYEKRIAGLGVRVAQLTKENTELKVALDRTNMPNPAVSGGTILWVNQRDNVAFLSLGSDDNLHRKTTFNVYPAGTANVTGVVPKGKVEVTNITGTHTSEARIVENPIGDPLLPGDLVHTAGWAPGQHPHYAIGGVIDLAGNGGDQTHKMREMIEATGGVVDAEVVTSKGDEGKLVGRVKGAITINTRYLILGDPKVDTPEGAARLAATTTLITEANRLHVEQIGLNKFLGMIGYVAPVGVGPGAAGATIQGTIQGAPNNAFQNSFRPRQPGAAAPAAGTTP